MHTQNERRHSYFISIRIGCWSIDAYRGSLWSWRIYRFPTPNGILPWFRHPVFVFSFKPLVGWRCRNDGVLGEAGLEKFEATVALPNGAFAIEEISSRTLDGALRSARLFHPGMEILQAENVRTARYINDWCGKRSKEHQLQRELLKGQLDALEALYAYEAGIPVRRTVG